MNYDAQTRKHSECNLWMYSSCVSIFEADCRAAVDAFACLVAGALRRAINLAKALQRWIPKQAATELVEDHPVSAQAPTLDPEELAGRD